MMLSLRIAFRYLLARKSHAAVNIISGVSMAGIAVATIAIVCVLSVFNGFTQLAMSRLSVFDPELRVAPVEGSVIEHADSLSALIAASLGPGVTAQPVVSQRALAVYGDHQQTIVLKGVPAPYAATPAIDNVIIDGAFIPDADSPGGGPYATIGVGSAITLKARPGVVEPLRLFVPRRRGRINPANPMGAFRTDSVFVSGVFQLDQAEYDNDFALIPVGILRNMLDYSPAEATAIEINFDSPDADINAARAKIEQIIAGSGLSVENRLEQQEQSYRMIAVEKWISLLLLIFILVIASFNVLSSISMLVIEKRNDIDILGAIGATSGFINRIFTLQGTAITIIGGAIGLLLGVALSLAQQWGGFIKLSGDPSRLSIDVYPVKVEGSDILLIGLILVAVSLAVGAVSRLIARTLGHQK